MKTKQAIKDITEKAIRDFNNEKNCSQSVLGVYAEAFNLDKNTLFRLAMAFGGGMGHTNGVCGAVSGGLMVFGFLGRYNRTIR